MTNIYRIFCAGLIVTSLLTACGGGDGKPNLSKIDVRDIHIDRFDKAFFAIDSNNVEPGLRKLAHEYPWFTGDFVGNILGAGPLSDTSHLAFLASRQFLTSYLPVRDSLEKTYAKLDWLEKELTTGFKYIKYYFPAYALPSKVVAYIGPFNGPGVAITPYALAIGLQSYAGRNFSYYLSSQGQEDYPAYISRRFEPAYITTNCLTALAQDIYPDSSENRPMIEQMVIKGKYMWLAKRLQPDAPDSIRTGYTASQLKWCSSNEGGIWNYFLQNTDLYTVDPDIIKNYIGDGPKTLSMPDASPGNIGAWVGYQIVNKYYDAHQQLTPRELLQTPARKIFEDSKYKPK